MSKIDNMSIQEVIETAEQELQAIDISPFTSDAFLD